MYGSVPLHNDLKIFKIKDMYEIALLKFVYKCIHGKTIDAFTNFFSLRGSAHGYNTRGLYTITRHRIHTEIGRSSPSFSAATLWNNLSDNCKSCKTISNFKKTLSIEYRNKYYMENINDA